MATARKPGGSLDMGESMAAEKSLRANKKQDILYGARHAYPDKKLPAAPKITPAAKTRTPASQPTASQPTASQNAAGAVTPQVPSSWPKTRKLTPEQEAQLNRQNAENAAAFNSSQSPQSRVPANTEPLDVQRARYALQNPTWRSKTEYNENEAVRREREAESAKARAGHQEEARLTQLVQSGQANEAQLRTKAGQEAYLDLHPELKDQLWGLYMAGGASDQKIADEIVGHARRNRWIVS